MKKLLIVVAVLIALVVAGAAVFIMTFDANKYRGLIETKASEALGSQVKIGSVDLRFRGGLALGIQKLGVYEKGLTAPSLSVDGAEVSLKLMPLLRKSVEVGSVRIDRPRITLIKEENAVRVLGVNLPPAATNAGPAKPSSGGAPAIAFLIGEVKIIEGEINYRDVTVKPASQIAVKHLNVTVKNVSLAGPVRFDAEAAVFGDRRNVSASGEAVNLAGGKPELRDFVATLDLGLIDFGLLEKGVPAVKQSGLRRELAGKLEVRADRLIMGPKGPEKFSVSVKLADGRAGLVSLKPYFENIQLAAQADEQTARIDNLSLKFSEGTVKAKAVSKGYMKTPMSDMDVSVQSVRIEPLVPLTSDGKPIVEGAASFTFKGSAIGAAWPQISDSLNGQATLTLEKGILLNLNIIRELLGKLTMFPGLVESLERSLPESYRPKLTRQSTILNPMEHRFEIKDGTVLIRDLQVSTDFFVAKLDADARLSGSLDGRGSVQLDETFSKAMLDGFPETQFLANGLSQIELPLLINYSGGRLSVLPDLKRIVKNMTGGGGKALLSGLLGGGSATTGTDPAGTAPAAPAQGTAQPAPTQQEKVLGWLNKITDTGASSGDPQS